MGATWRADEFVLLARARTHVRHRPWGHPPLPQTCGQGVAAWDGSSAVVSMSESHRPLGARVEHFISPHTPVTATHTHTHRKGERAPSEAAEGRKGADFLFSSFLGPRGLVRQFSTCRGVGCITPHPPLPPSAPPVVGQLRTIFSQACKSCADMPIWHPPPRRPRGGAH